MPTFNEELASLAADLRQLRIERGKPSYRDLAARAARSATGIRLPVATQSEAFRGERLLGLDRLMGLVRILYAYDAFGAERPVPPHNSPELEPWRRRWRELAALEPARRSPAAAPPVPGGGTGFAVAHVLSRWVDNNYCAAFSPDGRILAVSGVREDNEGVVHLWDPVRGASLGTIEGEVAALSLAFSPSSGVLAVGDMHGTVHLWDTATLEPARPPLLGHDGSVDAVAFTPDGRILAAADDVNVIIRWDVATGEPVGRPLTGHSGEIKALSCLPDGRVRAAFRDGQALSLWEFRAGSSVGTHLTENPRLPLGAAFSADGALLAMTGHEETSLWDTATHALVRSLPATGEGGSEVAFSADGRRLATVDSGGTVRLWDPSTGDLLGRPLTTHKGPFSSAALSPDGRMLAVCGESNSLVVYHDTPHTEHTPPPGPLSTRALGAALRQRQAVALPPLAADSGVALRRLAFSPDGGRLVVRAKDGQILSWDPAARVQLPESLFTPPGTAPWGVDFLRGGGPARLWTRGGPHGHPVSLVSHVSFCGGRKVAVIGAEGRVSVLDAADDRKAGHVPDDVSDVFALAAAADGSRLAAAMGERVVLWDPSTPEEAALELVSHLSSVGALAFSPDGDLLATGDSDGHVLLWDVRAPAAPAHRLSGHAGPVHDLAFSSRGDRLASASGDGTVRLWDTATGEAAGSLPLTGHTGAVRGVAFSPDASLLASAGDDGTLRCWLLPGMPTARLG
ncbi:WD40 repeat domain-containing protein [Streptomyces sp. NPDC048352]|uniref:WD40 repeat domain-containing protein n=1 Tax=Streptomyces sp. NPDC048352 TaxID=3154718 RepID=UPI003429B63A